MNIPRCKWTIQDNIWCTHNNFIDMIIYLTSRQDDKLNKNQVASYQIQSD